MSTVRERIAYVRGLIEGADLARNGAVTRDVLEKMLDIFDAIADEVEEMEVGRLEVEQYLEAIDADLGDLEVEVLGDELDGEEGDDDETDGHFIEMQCPSCRVTVYFEDDILFADEDDIACPECGEVVYRVDGPDRDDDESSLL